MEVTKRISKEANNKLIKYVSYSHMHNEKLSFAQRYAALQLYLKFAQPNEMHKRIHF